MQLAMLVWKKLRNIRLFPVIFWIIALSIIGSFIWYTNAMKSAQKADNLYSYAMGHFGDFYGYSYMIRRGQEGHILYKNVYTTVQSPELLHHPFYHALGLLSGQFTIAPNFIFWITKLVAWVLLFFSVYILIERTVYTETAKILAGILFLSATSIWNIQAFLYDRQIIMPVAWSDYFDPTSKYIRIPPHHLFAFVCLIWITLIVFRESVRRRDIYIGSLLCVCIGLLQPYISFFLTIILSLYVLVHRVWSKRFPKAMRLIIGLCVVNIIMIAMNYYILQYVLHLPFASTNLISQSSRSIHMGTFVAVLGPVFWVSLLVFGSRGFRKIPIIRFLVLWAWTPLFLFVLPEVNNLTSTYRLLQTYQQIPFALLAAAGIDGMLRKTWYKKSVVVLMVCTALLYGFVPYISNMYQAIHTDQTGNFYLYIPTHLLETFSYIDKHTKADSVILAGGAISSMIPAYTHNKVFAGHDSTTPDFTRKQEDLVSFFQGTMTPAGVKRFVEDNHISYVIFGLDAPSWSDSPYNGFDIFSPIYKNNVITLTQTK